MQKDIVATVCPHCGMEMRIRAQFLGRKGRCKCCNEVFIASPSALRQPQGPAPHLKEHTRNMGTMPIGKILVYAVAALGIALPIIFVVFQIQEQCSPRETSAAPLKQDSENRRTDTPRAPASLLAQRERLTAEQRNIFDAALAQAGFEGYKSLALTKDGWVELVYEVPPAVIAGQALAARMTLEEYLEYFASGAVRTVKDVLPLTGMAHDTPCRVRVQGPSPEPGVIGAYGWAAFTDQLTWKIQDQ